MGWVKCLQFALPLSLTSRSDEFKEPSDTVRQTRCFQMSFNVSIHQLLKPNNVIFSQAWRLRSELKTEFKSKTGKAVESLSLWCHRLWWEVLLHCKKTKKQKQSWGEFSSAMEDSFKPHRSNPLTLEKGIRASTLWLSWQKHKKM